jgi:hypothetical protein
MKDFTGSQTTLEQAASRAADGSDREQARIQPTGERSSARKLPEASMPSALVRARS